ncbi:MAG: TonB-dependent receptor, partial [Acidobacteria bacterium]|nr:TonB-dependent receptor [Acidobacteriota bacterium]MCI0718168.1 TonB-dependent receptor [Acidobacteriota bacterium]
MSRSVLAVYLSLKSASRILAVAIALVLGASTVVAQDRGTISGIITDSSGAAIPGANVTALNPATNLAQTAVSSDDGTYNFLYLQVGNYTVTAEKPGFSKGQATDVRVSVNTTARVDVQLQVGEIQQTLEVRAEAPLLQTERSDLGRVVSTKAILDLPLFLGGGLRNNLAFVSLVPGVQGAVGEPRIGGGLVGGASMLLDGSEAMGERRFEPGFSAVSAEAVEEFKVQTGSYSAEYGRTSNGIVNFTSKSGTNDLHGSLFGFLRNEAFNARRFTYGPGTREISRQHLGGGSVGGPILRNKAFFFFAYERSKFRSGSPSNVITLPIEDFRRGDFRRYTDASGNVVPLYDPFDASGRLITDAFARPRMQCNGVLNVICPERIDPVARLIHSELPQPDNPSIVFNNTRAVGNPGSDSGVYSIKGDYHFSDKNRLSGLFSRQFREQPSAIGPIPGKLGENFNNGTLSKWYRVNHDYVFTPNLLSHFSFGYNQREGDEISPTPTSRGLSEAFRSGIQLKGMEPKSRVFSTYQTEFGNYFSVNDTFSPSGTLNLNEQIGWIKGRHSVKFGFQYLRAEYNRFDCLFCAGQVSFSPAATGNPGVSGRTGSNYAAFMLGLASGGRFNYGVNDFGFHYPYYAWYVQDDFKITNKLTLNIGLRYELSFPREERELRNSNFNPSIPNPGAGGLLGAMEFAGFGPGRSGKRRFQDVRKNAWGPRLGLAYQLTPKTVLRAGGAIYYQPMREDGNADRGTEGFGGSFFALGDFLATGISFQLKNGFNEFGNRVEAQRPPTLNPSLQNFSSMNYMHPETGRVPYFYDWNFTLEHSFSQNTLWRTSYHANLGVKLLNNKQNVNQLDPRFWAVYGDLLGRRLDDPLVIATGFQPPFPGYPANRQLQQALRPWPHYDNLVTVAGGDVSGHLTYHALETSFEHRFSNGLYFLTSYTFSKLMGNVDGENATAGARFAGADSFSAQQNQYNRAADKSVGNADLPHNLVVSYIYELPVGKGKKFLSDMHPVANAILGNWRFSGVSRYVSGYPLRV